MVAAKPAARVVEVEGAGHDLHLEQPLRWRETLRGSGRRRPLTGEPVRRRRGACVSASACSFFRHWFSIWRTRSRVTLNGPTSSRVRGCWPSRPSNLEDAALAQREGLEDARERLLAELGLGRLVRSRGHLVGEEVAELDSSSSPTGFSSETGAWALRLMCSTSSGSSSSSRATSSIVGSRPNSLEELPLDAADLVQLLDDVTGIRIVRALSASARATAWRIHQVA